MLGYFLVFCWSNYSFLKPYNELYDQHLNHFRYVHVSISSANFQKITELINVPTELVLLERPASFLLKCPDFRG